MTTNITPIGAVSLCNVEQYTWELRDNAKDSTLTNAGWKWLTNSSYSNDPWTYALNTQIGTTLSFQDFNLGFKLIKIKGNNQESAIITVDIYMTTPSVDSNAKTSGPLYFSITPPSRSDDKYTKFSHCFSVQWSPAIHFPLVSAVSNLTSSKTHYAYNSCGVCTIHSNGIIYIHIPEIADVGDAYRCRGHFTQLFVEPKYNNS